MKIKYSPFRYFVWHYVFEYLLIAGNLATYYAYQIITVIIIIFNLLSSLAFFQRNPQDCWP